MAAVTPALKDLPKVSDDLKTQLEAFSYDQMKHAATKEKIVLPSAEGNYGCVRHFMCSCLVVHAKCPFCVVY